MKKHVKKGAKKASKTTATIKDIPYRYRLFF